MSGINNFLAAGKFFVVIAGELILIFIAVAFLVGLLTEYLPPSRIRDFLSKKFTWVQYLLGSGLGAITPFCSCSTVPITTGLLRGGVPFGPIMAFLFASPVLNPVIIALLWTLFGFKVTIVYVFVTFIGSMVAAGLLSKMGMENQVKPLMYFPVSCCDKNAKTNTDVANISPASNSCCSSENKHPSRKIILPMYKPSEGCCATKVEDPSTKLSQASCCTGNLNTNGQIADSSGALFQEKLKRATSSAITTFKGVFWYLMLGAGIGAFIYGFFPQDLLIRLAGPGNPLSIPVAAALGVPMYIRAETIIPISAALVSKGMGMGTVLALIIGGAGASIPELIILGSMFKKKLVAVFILNVFWVAIAAGFLVDCFIY